MTTRSAPLSRIVPSRSRSSTRSLRRAFRGRDGLTAHQATGLGAWAAGAARFMAKLAAAVPDFVEAITIFAHADQAGQDASCWQGDLCWLASASCRPFSSISLNSRAHGSLAPTGQQKFAKARLCSDLPSLCGGPPCLYAGHRSRRVRPGQELGAARRKRHGTSYV